MILLDNHNTGIKKEKLKDISQLTGTQLWIQDYPLRISARCHSDIGGDIDGKYFSTEELVTDGIGIMSRILNKINKFIDAPLDKGELVLALYDLSSKYSERIQSRNYSKEEWDCLLKDGFLGVLKMNYPELQDNSIVNFYMELSKNIEELEMTFAGRDFNEIVTEINNRVADDNTEKHGIWCAIQDIYINSPSIYMWVMNNGEGGHRKEYLESANFEEISRKSENDNTENINTIIDDFLKEHHYGTLEEFLADYLPELKNFDDFIEFCKFQSQGGYTLDGSLLSEMLCLYEKIQPYLEEKHSAKEIGEAVKSVAQSEVENVLKVMTDDTRGIQPIEEFKE